MVFFTSIIIILIFYFLKDSGIIFAIIIALTGEFINILLIHFQTISIKADLKTEQEKEIRNYKDRITTLEATIKDLDGLQKNSAVELFEANARIEDLEIQLEKVLPTDGSSAPHDYIKNNETTYPSAQKRQIKARTGKLSPLDHLPSGSNRKVPPK